MGDDIRERLATLRDLLLKESLFAGDTMAWGAAALSTFLDGSVPTLNHAFGLTLKASRPRDDDRRRELAAKASDLKQAGCTWKQVADAFYESGESITDDRSIRSLVLEYRVELISREVSRRVDAGHLGGK